MKRILVAVMFLSSCGLAFACPFATNIKLSPGAVALGKSAAITYDTAQDGSDGYYQIGGQGAQGETITSIVTDTSNNQQVGGPINGRTIAINAPGIYTVTTTVTVHSRKDDSHPDENIPSPPAVNILKVYKVDLVPLANAPLAPGRICLNAQLDYWAVAWKVSIKPDGTASVANNSGDVTVVGGANLSDGAVFLVTGGTSPGDYKLKIAHDTVADCTATKGDETFEFEMKNLGIAHGAVTRTTGQGTYWRSDSQTTDPYRFTDGLRMRMKLGVAPENAPGGDAVLSQGVTWKYKMTTLPIGAFAGNVKCTTKIEDQTTLGNLYVTGVLAVHTEYGDIGASIGTMSYNETINVSGLFLGNSTQPPLARSASVSAPPGIPLVLFSFLNQTSCMGTIVWDNNSAIYTVDDTVSVESVIQMKGTRTGGVPLSASGGGSAVEIGFIPTYGTVFGIQ